MRPFWFGFIKAAGLDKRVACVAVFRDGKMLMGKRKDNGRWTQPGGHLEPGEDPRAGAARELFEEAGIKLDPEVLKPLASKTVKKPDGKTIKVYAFVAHVPGSTKSTVRHDPDEEVHRWQEVDVRKGLPKEIAANLHVPLKDNVVMEALGLAG